MSAPKHAVEVRIELGGHSMAEVIARLADELLRYQEHGGIFPHVWGGWGGAGSVSVEVRDVSADQYRSELETWLAEQKAGATSEVTP